MERTEAIDGLLEHLQAQLDPIAQQIVDGAYSIGETHEQTFYTWSRLKQNIDLIKSIYKKGDTTIYRLKQSAVA